MNTRDTVHVSGTWAFVWHDEHGKETRRRTVKNLIVDDGLETIAAILAGEIEQDAAIYVALGTGTTPAAAGDVALETETTRKIITTKVRETKDWVLRCYFLQAEAVGTHTEVGVCVGATSAAGSGTLLNRVLPAGGIAKGAIETLTIEVKVSFAAA